MVIETLVPEPITLLICKAKIISPAELEVNRPDGSPVLPLESFTLPPSGQTAHMLDEIIDLPEEFTFGLLRASATGEMAVVAMRIRINERGEIEGNTQDCYFAHLADSDGWTTELMLYSGAHVETPFRHTNTPLSDVCVRIRPQPSSTTLKIPLRAEDAFGR